METEQMDPIETEIQALIKRTGQCIDEGGILISELVKAGSLQKAQIVLSRLPTYESVGESAKALLESWQSMKNNVLQEISAKNQHLEEQVKATEEMAYSVEPIDSGIQPKLGIQSDELKKTKPRKEDIAKAKEPYYHYLLFGLNEGPKSRKELQENFVDWAKSNNKLRPGDVETLPKTGQPRYISGLDWAGVKMTQKNWIVKNARKSWELTDLGKSILEAVESD